MNTKTVIGIVSILLALAGSFFGGRGTVRCPEISVPQGEIREEAPALPAIDTLTKPPPPVWTKPIPVLDLALLDSAQKEAYEAGYGQGKKDGWDECVIECDKSHNQERWITTDTLPHRKDSVIYYPAEDRFLIVHSGLFEPVHTLKMRSTFTGNGFRGLLYLEGAVWARGGADARVSIPNPFRPTWWFPERMGVGARTDGAKAVTFGWGIP